ncbi:gp436 family protein [Pseudomonas putida]|uniref:gp436 family protein n=1 Tax=Pseudomonas putida TaxID=303 RepID=UPI001F9F369A|nr:Mu-like prophage protein gp36 [Pseudomonas putida]CAB5541936.1 Mu-like prophage protein gp36 [Pseudomonas putida]CAB5543318.1 Mu-like prophage protein gp36 [Pseudomonas putida]CAB5638081.1 Mu-like prophage protein gp36 [Pseudomonas putida]CAB5653818.1 Mu-like prophage protein gp36 [Pseudomonas putida]
MRYCNRMDIGNAIPELTLVQLSNDDPAAEQPNESVIEEAVRQAEELVDGYMRGRYVLPLDPVPTVLRDAVVYLARHWLYQRRPEGTLPDAVKDSRKDTIKLLESIRDGVVTLGMPSGQIAPEPGEIRVRARRQQFGDDTWSGYR